MNIAKLILLACPVFLASILVVANPAIASSLKSVPAIQTITVASTQQITEFTTPKLAQASNPIIEQLGCNCGNCTQAKFQRLQGKLPSASF
ncbi:hypothetical protein [Nostoc sp. MG11]|uniref:hypothetical protein n=1 Tax=Nostoc sp. MG11 TaxID=2721166 RepID=UPI001866132D|nr:hypothetical protein [Nostoc sp. MG11]